MKKSKALENIAVMLGFGLASLMLLPALSWASDSFAVEVKILENRTDGCTQCGCQAKAVVESGQKRHWWMTFGLVEPSDTKPWRRLGPEALSYCGVGEFKSIRKRFEQNQGAPYIVVSLQTEAMANSSSGFDLSAKWSVSLLKGFNRRGKPDYQVRDVQTTDFGGSDFEFALPVLLASDTERDAFGVEEVVVSITGSSLGNEQRQYGNISVESDRPGAEVFLDDGLVGRIIEDQPIVLENIEVGDHGITVRDFSGRKLERAVRLDSLQSSSVRLDFLGDAGASGKNGLLGLGTNPQGFEEYWRTRDGAMVVQIPAGEFLMGSDDPASEVDERPAHTVLVNEFLIDKTEVTWRQFKKFATAVNLPLPPAPEWGRPDDFALSGTTWDEAQAFCKWVGGRLPTEAEWEKAARGVDGRAYPWGDEWDPNRCNSISGGLHQPEPVGSFHACISPYGVLDMAGSHTQWVSDNYDEKYYQSSPSENPEGPPAGALKVKRGGFWMSHPAQIVVTRRAKSDPTWRNFSHGFRCARDGKEGVK
jgi:formylglycine-generating enzyme required for sulfatase activity